MGNANFAIFLGAVISIPVMLHNQALGALVWVAVIFTQPYAAKRLRNRNPRNTPDQH